MNDGIIEAKRRISIFIHISSSEHSVPLISKHFQCHKPELTPFSDTMKIFHCPVSTKLPISHRLVQMPKAHRCRRLLLPSTTSGARMELLELLDLAPELLSRSISTTVKVRVE
jgi:hypothetical protein